MNRRTILLAIGAVAVLTGIVFGTGAFTQVEADRNVTVNVADDSQAFLGLNGTSQYADYTDTQTGGAGQDVVQIRLDDSSSGSGNGLGVNDNAVTNVTPVLNVTNQGPNPVDVNVSGAPSGVNLTGITNPVSVGETEQVGIIVVTGNASSNKVSGSITQGDIEQAITISAEDAS